jgi:hypothetical protein
LRPVSGQPHRATVYGFPREGALSMRLSRGVEPHRLVTEVLVMVKFPYGAHPTEEALRNWPVMWLVQGLPEWFAPPSSELMQETRVSF